MKIPPDVASAAQASARATGVPASVSIAQWALESGWGAHSPGNNPFGMKPRKGMNDPQQLLWTTEFIKGVKTKVQQPFRKFSSIAEAFVAHAQLLSTAPVYAAAMAVLPKGVCPTHECIQHFIHLMAGHYATDPQYEAKLNATINANLLWSYDV